MRKLKVGYQLDFRNPPGSALSFRELYHQSLAQVQAAEQLGFDSIWLTEHHFTDDGYLPALMPAAAAIAARTTRVTIGTYVLLAPFYHPLKLAEDAAFVDVVSGGRLRLGLGLGYRAEEFEGFGVPRAQRLGRTLETIEILKRAWTGERFSFDGKYFKFRDARVLPRPVSQPHPELLWGAGAAKSIRRAAQLDLSFASRRSRPAARIPRATASSTAASFMLPIARNRRGATRATRSCTRPNFTVNGSPPRPAPPTRAKCSFVPIRSA
jgi:alkanesulfonate monooxygenase SsuD/methylene tetrahydromethanopterin reductase-like flavin-dependent oxidoreductase (luciferase family)